MRDVEFSEIVSLLIVKVGSHLVTASGWSCLLIGSGPGSSWLTGGR